jgi:hypothetical protein
VAVNASFPAPTSYRACAGGDPAGQSGPFPLGGQSSRAAVEAADGLAYTAAFSERLIGTGEDRADPIRNYLLTRGPVGPGPCPTAQGIPWRGDAGSDWGRPDWTSSLYNHALVPGVVPSCLAADGRTARIGAGSGHVEGVHLLRMDLSVGLISPRIDPDVWRRLGTVRDGPAPAVPPPGDDGP